MNKKRINNQFKKFIFLKNKISFKLLIKKNKKKLTSAFFFFFLNLYKKLNLYKLKKKKIKTLFYKIKKYCIQY